MPIGRFIHVRSMLPALEATICETACASDDMDTNETCVAVYSEAWNSSQRTRPDLELVTGGISNPERWTGKEGKDSEEDWAFLGFMVCWTDVPQAMFFGGLLVPSDPVSQKSKSHLEESQEL